MAYIRQIESADAEGALKRVYDAASQRGGSVAHIIKVMGLDPRSTQASMGFYVGVMKSENALKAPIRELLAAVVSCVNDCFY